jgi:O-antigen/teichoic acid export membrane protein
MAGAWITLIGTTITIVINWIFIPRYSYIACAWATFFCYTTMMIISFLWGQKKYFIPYPWKKLLAYLFIVVLLFFIHKSVTSLWNFTSLNLGLATLLIFAYMVFILLVEKKEFQQLPVVRRFIK